MLLLTIYLIVSTLMSMVFYIIANIWHTNSKLESILFSLVLGFSGLYLLAIPVVFWFAIRRR